MTYIQTHYVELYLKHYKLKFNVCQKYGWAQDLELPVKKT